MARRTTPPEDYGRITVLIRNRIEAGGERLWQHDDFRDLPSAAVAQVLSRLASALKCSAALL